MFKLKSYSAKENLFLFHVLSLYIVLLINATIKLIVIDMLNIINILMFDDSALLKSSFFMFFVFINTII